MYARELPAQPSLEQYKKQAKDLVKACKSGDLEALQRIKKNHPRFKKNHPGVDKLSNPEILDVKITLTDAQLVIAREYAFESWPKFAKHIEALTRKSSNISLFESAVEAIIAGDVVVLTRLLRENPQLIRERSTRVHQSTLLHYVGANGVEDYRQKTPKNAVEVLKILLKAGAEVNAVAELYGGTTTLGLVATSVHPDRAGVQNQLMETLLDAGAAIEHAVAPTYTRGLAVNACLYNDRPSAAAFLAAHGAHLDLEGAAGVGRLDLVESFFNEDGSLKENATKRQLQAGFIWACEYGQASVAEFLLEKGVDLRAGENTGQTALHLAAHRGQLAMIKLLLDRGAPLEAINSYGGTVLGQALWSVINGDPTIDFVPVIEMLLGAGAKIEPGSLTWLAEQSGSAAKKARIVEVLRRHGATS